MNTLIVIAFVIMINVFLIKVLTAKQNCNKIDIMNDQEINKKIENFNKKIKKKTYTISALKHEGLKNIKKILMSYVHK